MRLKSIFNLSGGRSYVLRNSRKEAREESKHSVVKSTMSEYVQTSTIHGVAYVGNNERNMVERFWWFIILVCSVLGACYLIYQSYRTMKENPIMESPSLSRTPMWDIPFPAVTLCTFSEDNATSLAKDINNWPNFTHSSLPNNFADFIVNEEISLPIVIPNLLLQGSYQNNYDILTQFLPEIKIRGATFRRSAASAFFQKTITGYGACVTFNMYQEKEILRNSVVPSSLDDATNKTEQLWSRDSGFVNNLPLRNYTNPFRLFSIADYFGIALDVNDSRRFLPFDNAIMVALHAPDEYPLLERHSEFLTIVPRKHNRITIVPRIVMSEGIEHYDPVVRQCYYSDERYLKFYKIYTQKHCEMECLANYTLAKCGCVFHYHPRLNNTKLCTVEFECAAHEDYEIYVPDLTDNVAHAPIDDCNCLPSCTQLWYKPVLVTTLESQPFTMLDIYNKNLYIEKHVRTELHSISEFFSNCGGALGLLLGVSIFSIVELFYFCTVRLYLHSRRRHVDPNE